jgi:hypothetical protein
MGETMLFATLWAGAGLFGVATILAALLMLAQTLFRRATPVRFALCTCALLCGMYLLFGTDWSAGFYLRPDSVQPSRMRSIVTALLYTLQSAMLVSACHVGYQDGMNLVLVGAATGTMFGLADLGSDGVGWLPFAGGLIGTVALLALAGIKSGANDWRAISAYLAAMAVFFVPLPICQALAWPLGGQLDGGHVNRDNAEVFFLCVYALTVLWDFYVSLTYERMPDDERRRDDWLEHDKTE